MNELIKKVIAGAISGFVSAFMVDFGKWKATPDLSYDWKLAIKNWLLGAVGGAVTAFGFGNVV